MGNGHLTLNVEELLVLFDDPPNHSKRHTNSILAIVGEDLGATLLCNSLEEADHITATVLNKNGWPITPGPGTNTGRRLDRWILTEDQRGDCSLYQVEIKNWNTQSVKVGGGHLRLKASEKELQTYRVKTWKDIYNCDRSEFCFKNGETDERTNKVLSRMKLPADEVDDKLGSLRKLREIPNERIHPLICFWVAIHPQGRDEALFYEKFHKEPINGFGGVWVFSMSNYLRKIRSSGVEHIEARMPIAEQRINLLNSIVEHGCGAT